MQGDRFIQHRPPAQMAHSGILCLLSCFPTTVPHVLEASLSFVPCKSGVGVGEAIVP